MQIQFSSIQSLDQNQTRKVQFFSIILKALIFRLTREIFLTSFHFKMVWMSHDQMTSKIYNILEEVSESGFSESSLSSTLTTWEKYLH